MSVLSYLKLEICHLRSAAFMDRQLMVWANDTVSHFVIY